MSVALTPRPRPAIHYPRQIRLPDLGLPLSAYEFWAWNACDLGILVDPRPKQRNGIYRNLARVIPTVAAIQRLIIEQRLV